MSAGPDRGDRTEGETTSDETASDEGRGTTIRRRVVETIAPFARAADRWLPDRVSRLLRRFADGEILLTASSLAFYGLVSTLPLLLITFAVVGFVAGEETLETFAEQVSESGVEGMTQFIDQLVASGGSLTLVTLLFTAWPATAYGGGLRQALSKHSERSESGSGARGRLLGLSLVLTLPALVLAGIPLMFFLTTLSGDGALATILGWTLALVAGTVLGTVLTTLLYRAFAPGSLGLRETVSGAALSAVVTGVFSLLFVTYLQLGEIEERFGGGTIAVTVLIGVWLFAANIVLLGGFETVLELAEERGDEPDGEATDDDPDGEATGDDPADDDRHDRPRGS